LGLGDECARDGDALAHAPRDLGRVLASHALEPHLGQRRLDSRRDLGGAQAQLLPEREGHVAGARHRVEQRAALEDDAVAPPDIVERAPVEAGDVRAIHEHTARVGAQETDQVPEKHRLTAAAPADDDRDRARGDVQVEPPQRLLPAERLDEPLDLYHRLASPTPAARTATLPRLASAVGRPAARTATLPRLASAVGRPAARTATLPRLAS